MNTKMQYLYRDAANYKARNYAVVKGDITPQQKDIIKSALHDNVYFIPSQIGLEEERPGELTEDDHPWFELYPDVAFEPTNQKTTTDMSVDELVEKFKQSAGNWDETPFYEMMKDMY